MTSASTGFRACTLGERNHKTVNDERAVIDDDPAAFALTF